MMKQLWFKILLASLALILFSGMVVGWLYNRPEIHDDVIGVGPSAKGGQTVTFDYRAYLYDESAPQHLGQVVDSTYERHQPHSLILGASQAILGLEKGLYGMRPGGRRNLIIPPHLAYGEAGAGGGLIPPGAKLVYQIEMRRVD